MLFFLLTIGMTWPFILQLNTHVTPGQQPAMSVSYLGLWTLAWNHHWIRGQADGYWDANHFAPHRKTLAYSEPQFGIGLLTFPVMLFGGNTVLAYNLAILAFFWGAGMAIYALCWWLFGLVNGIRQNDRCIASITAGILYAFTPYMFEQIALIQLLTTLFPPLCLLALHRFFHQKRWVDALLFSAGFLGCWYTCAYYGLFFSVFVVSFTLVFWNRGLLTWQNLLRGLVSVMILMICLLPLANGMHSAKTALSHDWPVELVRGLSAALMEYFQFPASSLLYEHILGLGSSGGSLFGGGMLLCLACVGVITVFRSPVMINNGSVDSKIPSMNHQIRPSFRRCGVFYIAMALVAFILSLGLALTPTHTDGLGVYRFLVWLSPYNLLHKFVPGFSSIRAPNRFCIFVVLFLAILAGLGMLWVCHCFRSRKRWGVIVFLISISIFELWPTPLRFVKVPVTEAELPRIYQHLKNLPADAVLIEYPLSFSESEQGNEEVSRTMYFSTFHWYRLVDGYTSFAPPANFDLQRVLERLDTKSTISALKAFGIDYLLAHWGGMPAEQKMLLRTLEVAGNLKPIVREGNQHTLYQIDNSQHKSTAPRLPNIERLAIYEGDQQQRDVRVCFYYQIEMDEVLLVTPWQNSVECQISWYKKLESAPEKDSKPILVKNVPFQGSRLLNASLNAIAIAVPAPAPGKYRVTVKHRLSSRSVTKTGVCEIYPHGFVRFHEDP
ncbi:MAG: YfhO family protein [Gammaproteobacteria bacterium]|nr:YfhO family protein [Gammaproteobacteria bacterium]